MARRRLLFLITRFAIGGPAKVTGAVAGELASPGHEVYLADGDPEPGEAPDPLAAASTLLRRHVPGLARAVRPSADLAALRRLVALIRELRPNVLLTTGSKGGLLGRLAAWRTTPRPRTVHVFHGHVFRGHFSGPVGWAFAQVERWLAAITDGVVSVCGSVTTDLRALGLDRKTRLHTVPIGCDLSPYLAVGPRTGALAEQLSFAPTAPLVIHPGRICPVKNQALVVEAAGLAREALDRANAAVLFVGDGAQRDELEARTAALGLADRVRFLGYREEMAPIYRDASLAVLASRNEAIPMSLIEAAAAGRRRRAGTAPRGARLARPVRRCPRTGAWPGRRVGRRGPATRPGRTAPRCGRAVLAAAFRRPRTDHRVMTREALLLERAREWAPAESGARRRWLERHGLVALLPYLLGPNEARSWTLQNLDDNDLIRRHAEQVVTALAREGDVQRLQPVMPAGGPATRRAGARRLPACPAPPRSRPRARATPPTSVPRAAPRPGDSVRSNCARGGRGRSGR